MKTEPTEIEGLLHGVRIIDLTDDGAAFCSKVLADLGARVIRIEKPGDDGPQRTLPLTGPEISPFYHNANKDRVTLDIETVEGRERFLRLLRDADAVVENFPPGYLEDHGFSYEAMREVNPAIILASVTGFGQTGPRRDYKSCDLVASAFGGQMYVSGESGGVPLRAYGGQSAYLSSLFAAVGILLALIRRRDTGHGEHVDISAQEAVAGTLDHVLVRYLYNGIIPRRQGSLSWNRSSFILPSMDGHIHITIGAQWETLVEWMEGDGLAGDLAEERWKDVGYRSRNIGHIMDVMGQWTRTHDGADLFEIAQAMRFPWAPVVRPEDVCASPQLVSRKFFSPTNQPYGGNPPLIPGAPYRFDGVAANPAFRRKNLRRSQQEAPFDKEAPHITATDAILKGVRVIDFTWVLAGPFATRILADFGAEVIKVQSLRTAKGPESNLDGYFSMWNRNKRSITLDMGHEEARDLVLRLAAKSDVVIENFAPRVMANWGLTYEQWSKVNPRIIMASMSAMGQTGPWKDYVAFGPALQSLSGLTFLTSFNEKEPLGPGYAYGDHVIGLYGALAVLAALENRRRTGSGRYIDLSGYEALCGIVGPALIGASLFPGAAAPEGNHSAYTDAAPSGCYPCLGDDRWCVISVSTHAEWQGLCTVMGRPGLIDDGRFRDALCRKANEALLDRLIAEWTSLRTPDEVVALLQEAGVPAGIVQNAEDIARDPHLRAREFFVPLSHPVLGSVLADRSPIRFGEATTPSWKPAPLLGEDNRYVFKDLLGLTEEEYLRYCETGIIS